MITVMGATANIGGEITRKLLEAGEDVRALGRSEGKLAELERAGATALAGDATYPGYLSGAFSGAEAAFTLLPYDPFSPAYHSQQNRLGETIVQAIREAGVRHVVALSSVGADLPSGTGFVGSLHRQERRLRQLGGTNVLVLRPGSFFENFHAALELIGEQGISGDAVAPDVPIPMIATRDVAAVAAGALAARDWQGFVVRELLGQRDLTHGEVTRIIGERIGRPDLQYVQFSYANMARALVQMGFSEDAAGQHVELARALNEGTVRSRQGRSPETTTPTSFEAFAAGLGHAQEAA